MDGLLPQLIHRFRPRIGWPQALLAFVVALCPAFAAADTPLRLPARIFFWAGLIGLLVGMRVMPKNTRQLDASSAPAEPSITQPVPQRPIVSRLRLALRPGLWLLVEGGLGAIFLIAVGGALPPAGLILQDLMALIRWTVRLLPGGSPAGILPASRTVVFLAESLPRAWNELMAAPSAGEPGARLLVSAIGVGLTWIGTLALGWASVARRSLFGWGLPLLAALTLITMFGGGSGAALVTGIGALLLLALVVSFSRRLARWERTGTDFSDELNRDLVMWGVWLIGALIVLAWALPTSLSNPLADLLWRNVEMPSGLAVLERNIQRPNQPSRAEIGLSTLPALPLGQSLEQGPAEQLSLRVRLDNPLPNSPSPHYWRARLFNTYNGRVWTADARVNSFTSPPPLAGAFEGAILQEIEDLRRDQQLLIGLPDIVAISVPANAEYLPDGTLAALTQPRSSSRYQVLSRPQELAAAPVVETEPPNMSAYLTLPGNLPPRVRELAGAITGDRTSAYDQALALEAYLRELPYDYQVEPLPRNGDAVDQFLFEMRHGYCTYYASAMATMARSLGIPARVATGYATGEYDESSRAYLVRESDAHAWPELYIDGRWIPFEPTPIRPLPARAEAGTPQRPPAPAPAPVEQPDRVSGPLTWLGVLALIVLASTAGIWLTRRREPEPLVTRIQMDLERYGAQAGIPWSTGATLHEYGAQLAQHLDGATSALRELIELVERDRYGGRELGPQEQQRLRAAGEQLWAEFRRHERRRRELRAG